MAGPYSRAESITSLAYQHLVLYNPDTDETKIFLLQLGRVCDIAQQPSGNHVILIDQNSPKLWSKGRW